jgi:eukaryotic-like serine/threonine-protein kinase
VTRPGTIVAGRFEIEQLAGRGGMGAVYRARDLSTGQAAAIKILHDEATTGHRERFAREARLLAELTHPAIVRYLAFGDTDDGRPYLAMEWLGGEDLATRLRRSGLTPAESVRAITRAAAALGAAHARGIVHRDIKPSNLYLVEGEADRIKVLDFGIARIQAASDAITRTGAAIGTPRYMAPEQARGSRDLDARADVFSLGCVLFECLAGRSAFAGDNPVAVLAKILMEDAPRLRALRDTIPPALEALVARMLAKDPAARPRDGIEVARELAGFGEIDDAVPVARSRGSAVSVGEQRLVCVVFAEGAISAVRGEPELAAPHGPDAGLDASTTYTVVDGAPGENVAIDASRTATSSTAGNQLRSLSTVVAEYGGRAEVLADGSIVVTVLGQGAATDHAARAARCALAIRSLVPRAAMALAIGRCVVEDRLPLGELIDRATALLDVAPGARTIRVDEVAAGLLDVRFAIDGDEHGLVLAGERDVADLTRTLLGKPTPCVGREREIGSLAAIFDECVAEPRAHVVVVTGPAGIGKSRLRYELLRKIAAGTEVWIGRGDPMSAGAPFGLLAQALRRAAGIVEDEPLSVRHLKLKARVLRHVDPEIAPRVVEFLGELIGAPSPVHTSVQVKAARQDPELIGDQMLRACEDFFAAECAARPVVLVLEDLQWGDLPTVKFVDAIVRQLADQPLLVLAFARPDLDTVFPRLWSERHVERIQLGELSRRAAERLVRGTLGDDVDAATVARLVDRAAGNAFYLEELIRSVAEGYGDRLPETVVAMAQARLEALDPEARHVLRAASVFGTVFWRGGVAALLEGGTTQVHDWLDELVRRELISVRRDSRFAGEAELVFRHSLVREAAYAMLTDRDRTHGHRLAGEWLEARLRADPHAAEVDAVALAEHFLRGGDLRRSISWYQTAAEQALEGNDLESAIDRAERAIACVRAVGDTGNPEDDRLVGVLRQLQAGAHAWRGEYARAAECGDEALVRLPVASLHWFLAAAAIADARTRQLQHAEVIVLCRDLADAALTPETCRAFVRAATLAMPTLLWHGDTELVTRLFIQIDRVEAEVGGEPATLAWVHTARSWRAMRDGDLAACLVLDSASERCHAELGDLRHACQQRASVGYHELMLGGFAEAECSLRDAITIATRMGLHQVTTQAQHNLGLVLARQGRIAEAREVECAARDAGDAQGNRRVGSAARHYLALIELAGGDAAAAITHVCEALAAIDDLHGVRSYYQSTLARAHLLAGDPDAALAEATRAMQYMELDGRPEEGESAIRLAHAEALAACGHHDAARRAIVEAAAELEAVAARIGDPAWRASFLDNITENARTLELARGS